MNSIVVILGVVITLVTGAPVAIQLMRGHPRGLFVLFFAEMWERFSYYGMRGLLVFYLTQQFLFTDKAASGQYGSYATLVYLLPLVGGVLADRYLGARKAVAFGALLLVAGHMTMAVEGAPARQELVWAGKAYPIAVAGRGDTREAKLMVAGQPYAFAQSAAGDFQVKGLAPGGPVPTVMPKGGFQLLTVGLDRRFVDVFYLALALIIMGVGFLKANISSLVGQLYAQGDPRRDPGFTLYYYGVNLGAFWAAILCGYLGQRFGWSWGFGLAGVGMLAGYLSFVAGRRTLQGRGEPPDPVRLAARRAGPFSLEHLIYLGGLAGVGVVWILVRHHEIVGGTLGIGIVAALGYVGWFMAAKCGKVERERLLLAFVLVAGSVVFFTLFEQAATSLNLFADRNTNLALVSHPSILRLPGGEIFFGTRAMWQAAGAPAGALWIDMGFQAAQTQSFNAGFILLFAPIFAATWSGLARRRRDPDPVSKFGLGLAQVGLGFLVIVWCAGSADASFKVPLAVLAFAYLLHTTGELCLSPVGMSEITKLSPPILISTMLAVWFLAVSLAEYVGAIIAALAGTATAGGQVLDPAAALATSVHMFRIIGWVGVGCGAVFLGAAPFLKRWGHGVNDPANHPRPGEIAPVVDAGVQEVNPGALRP
ncbi:MAG: MFS transporter [Caulobacteraceae bacterium]|nr:MFS transporter [Caulobacteraceae bacterium]